MTYQRWSNLFFLTNPNPNIIRKSENFRIRIRILFEILKKIQIYIWISKKVRIFEYYSNNSVIFERNVENKKQKAGFAKAYSKTKKLIKIHHPLELTPKCEFCMDILEDSQTTFYQSLVLAK